MRTTGSHLLDRLVDAVNRHDAEAMVECLADEYRSEQPLYPSAAFTGREQVGLNWSAMFAEIPDLHFDVIRAAAVRDEVWIEARVHGHKTDGSPFEYRGVMINRVHDDRISWARFYFDTVEEGGGDIEQRQRAVLGNENRGDPRQHGP